MHPILFKFGSFQLYTYGLFVATGFLVAIQVAKFEAKRVGENSDHIMDLAFYILLSAILGARFFYVIINSNEFTHSPLAVFKIWQGGLVFYGGFISALCVGLIYVHRKKMNVWKTADILAPSIAIGHALGRLGCFFAGCCYGKVCHAPWAITFTNPHSLAPVNVPLHPTQLYSVLANLILFIFLLIFKYRKTFDGQVFWVYVGLYGMMRSFIEIFRGDDRGTFLLNLFSVSQIIGIGFSLCAIVFYLHLKKKAGSSAAL